MFGASPILIFCFERKNISNFKFTSWYIFSDAIRLSVKNFLATTLKRPSIQMH